MLYYFQFLWIFDGEGGATLHAKPNQRIHVFRVQWNMQLEIFLHCWVIWKVADLPSSPPPLWRPILAFGGPIWRLPTWGGAKSGHHWGGGVELPSRGLSPKHKEYSFLPRSPYLHDILLMFLMLYSPLDTVLLLILLQPSGDGYFLLCSSKSNFRSTVVNPFISDVYSLPSPYCSVKVRLSPFYEL